MTDRWNWPGSRWWCFDLHTHSPGSYDFRPQVNVSNFDWSSWIEAACQAGLHAVAITDHNTAKGIEPLKKSASESERSLYVFPGVEITANDGTHLLLILDPRDTDSDVEHVLTLSGIKPEERGDQRSRSTLSVEQILDLAVNKKTHGLFIGAHVNREKGLLKHKGLQLIAELNHPGLAAVEILPNATQDEEFIDNLQGVDHEVSRVWCSDGHKLNKLGKRYTWIKMTRPSLEGLRLALLDGTDSLIPAKRGQHKNPNKYPSIAIESILIRDAKYQGRPVPLEVKFNPWLNTIIGGRGTGKSSLIDFCRKIFRRDSELDDCKELKKAFESRFRIPNTRDEEGLLTSETIAQITYRKNESRFMLSWSDRGNEEPIVHLKGDIEEAEKGNIRRRFPVRIYSQKQLFELARDPNALLTVIDDSDEVRGETFRRSESELGTRYLALRAQARSLLSQAKNLTDLSADLLDVRRKLKLLQKGGHAKVLNTYRMRKNQDRIWTAILDAAFESVQDLEQSTANLVVSDLNLGADESSETPEIAIIRTHAKLRQVFENLKKSIYQTIEQSKSEIEILLKSADLSLWKQTLSQSEIQYHEVSSELEAAGVTNPNEYRELLEQASELEQDIDNINQILVDARQLNEEAEQVLTEYRKCRLNLSHKRHQFADNTSDQYFQIKIDSFSRFENLDNFLRTTLGILSFENDFVALGEEIKPQWGQDWKWENLDKVVSKLRQVLNGETNAWSPRDKRFIRALEKIHPEKLDRLALYLPEDQVVAKYLDSRNPSATWKSLTQGSPGQQTAALLSFVLSYGSEPIILDQPEDDLDNTLIYELLVKRLRETRLNRQIIIVTHNPNIVVHGNAELVISLDSHYGQTKILYSGGLQEREIRNEICRVMEGGLEAFKTRYRRIIPMVGGIE